MIGLLIGLFVGGLVGFAGGLAAAYYVVVWVDRFIENNREVDYKQRDGGTDA